LKVGYIGLGFLGAMVARSIAEGGFDTVVFDRDSEAMESFQAPGASFASSEREIGRTCDIVVVCSVGDTEVQNAVSGAFGLLSGPMAPESTIVVQSAVKPETCRDLRVLAAAHGVELIDAPVVANGERSKRTIAVSGSEEAYKRCRAVLGTFTDADRILHVGPTVGLAQAIKLLNNLLLVVNMGMAGEALELGDQLGVPRRLMEAALLGGSGNSQGLRSLLHPQAGLARLLELVAGDVAVAQEMAVSAGVELGSLARRSNRGLAEIQARVSADGGEAG
jgi:3-hydroxyisobutyrate dehydrogenase-like beta-hydroxyacid dehydrogenase